MVSKPLTVSLSSHRWLEWESFDKLKMNERHRAASRRNRLGEVEAHWLGSRLGGTRFVRAGLIPAYVRV